MKKIETALSKYCNSYEIDNDTIVHDFGIRYDENGNEHRYIITEKYDEDKRRVHYQDSMGYAIRREYEGDFIFEYDNKSDLKKVYNKNTNLILSTINNGSTILFVYNDKNQCISECEMNKDKASVTTHETPINTDTNPVYKCLPHVRFPEFYGLKTNKREG